MVWFNYRRVPAIALARQLIDEGRLGRIYHYRSTYLQDWTISEDVPLGGPTLGAWKRKSPGPASQEIWRATASTPQSGSTALSSRCRG